MNMIHKKLDVSLARNAQRKYQSLSRMLSGNPKLRLQFGGDTAYMDKRHGILNLPLGDFNDQDFVDLIAGLIDHEVGHYCHTPDGFMLSDSKLKNALKNIFEDVRMEQLVFADYRGARANLSKTVDMAIKRGWFGMSSDARNDSTNAVVNYLLSHCRSQYCNQIQLNAFADAWAEVVDDLCDFRQQLDILCEPLGRNASADLLDKMADDVIALLQAHNDAQENPPPSNETPSDSSDNDTTSDFSDSTDVQDDEADVNDGSSADGNSDSESDEAQSSEDGSNATQSGAMSGDDAQTSADQGSISDDDNQSQTSQATPSEHGDGAGEVQKFDLDSDDIRETDLHDFAEALAEALAGEAKHHGRVSNDFYDRFMEPNVELEGHGGDYDRRFYHFEHQDVAHIAGIRGDLKRLLCDKAVHKRSYRDSGSRIASHKLAGIKTNNFNVFRHDTVVKAENTAVHLLIDSSGSMDGEQLIQANKMAYALAYSMDGLRGVVNQVGYFPGNSGECFSIVKPFNGRAKTDAFIRGTTGSTPTAQAIQGGIIELLRRNEPKKLMIVVTDGSPNSTDLVVSAKQEAQALGIKILAFGLNTYCYGFDDHEQVVCGSVDELRSAIQESLTKNLF